MVEVGDYFLLCYAVEGEPLWHERFCTGVSPNRDGVLATLTPDGDHYVEQCTMANEDLAGIRWLAHQGEVPEGVAHDRVYQFRDAIPAGRRARMLRDGALMVGARPPAPDRAIVAAGPGGEAPGVGRAAAPRPAAAAAGRRVWVVVEDGPGRSRGDLVPDLGAEAVVSGSYALVEGEGGAYPVRLIDADDRDAYRRDDLRVLPVQYDAHSRRRRDFTSVVGLLVEEEPEGGLDLEGEASLAWVLHSWVDSGHSPISHHDHWMRSAAVPAGDRSGYEHEVLCRILHSMLTVDQLNVVCLQSAELCGRRVQLIEDAHRASPSCPDYSAADHYMGWTATQGGASVAPGLRRHVAARLKAEADISKEARKAREEAALRRQKPRAKPKGGGRGGGGAEAADG